MRLQIRPALATVWRSPQCLQIGLDPRCGVVLDGVTAADEHLIDALRSGAFDLPHLRRTATHWGLTPARVDDLIEVLTRAGVLRRLPPAGDAAAPPVSASLSVAYPDEDGWQAAARRHAAVVGVAGPFGERIAALLKQAGIGCVVRGRDTAEVLTRARTRRRLALVVVGAHGAVHSGDHQPLVREDIPHLQLLAREAEITVGPLVRPGSSCCLRCLDEYRRGRDAGWPLVVSQLAGVAHPIDPALVELGCAVAASEVLAALDACCEPASLGASLHLRSGSPVPALRRWPVHPRCGCRHGPLAPTTAERRAREADTMGA